MNYILSARFQKEVKAIVEYIADNFGKQYALHFISELQTNIGYILKYPEASPIEPLLADRPTRFRSKIISKYNKAIYYQKGGVIYFTDLWDMRRNPDALVRRIRKNKK